MDTTKFQTERFKTIARSTLVSLLCYSINDTVTTLPTVLATYLQAWLIFTHIDYFILKLENVAIIAMYCHLRPPDAIAFPT